MPAPILDQVLRQRVGIATKSINIKLRQKQLSSPWAALKQWSIHLHHIAIDQMIQLEKQIDNFFYYLTLI